MRSPPKAAVLFAHLVLGAGLLLGSGLLAYVAARAPLRPWPLTAAYVAALGAGMLGLLLAFRLPRTHRVNVALALCSAGAGLYVAETALHLLTPSLMENRARAADRAGRVFDTRPKRAVIENLRSRGVDAYPDAHPSLFVRRNGLDVNGRPVFPLAAPARTTLVNCNETGAFQVHVSDERGFKNPPGAWAPDTIDAVLVGDSFAQGDCLPAGLDPARFLRQAGLHALSLGRPGIGPLIELAVLTEYAAPVRPRHVFWLYFEGNDLANLESEAEAPLLRAYLDPGFRQHLPGRQRDVERAQLAWLRARLETPPRRNPHGLRARAASVARLDRLRLRVQRLLGVESTLVREEETLALFERVIAEASRRTEAWGGTFHFVYLPDYHRYARPVDDGAFAYRDRVLEIVRRRGLSVVDLHPRFAAHPDPLSLFPWRLFGHYTEDGYRLLSGSLEAAAREVGN